MPTNDVVAAANVFDEMGASDSLHDATIEFVHLLDDNTVDIDQAPIDDYGYNEMDGGVHGHGRWDVVKPIYSHWAACLEQVHNAPPSDTVISDYDEIGQERYKDMEAFNIMSFTLDHCWKFLQKRQKWELIDKESPSKRGSLTEMDDDDDPRNKNKPNGKKKTNENIKKESEASSLHDKIDVMVQSDELMVAKTLEAKKNSEKKAQEKKE
ncbi:Lactation elevated protein 1 [Hordeum vulgare]|nr:Lactation elevated protein 1 [Hordeum vulgare]